MTTAPREFGSVPTVDDYVDPDLDGIDDVDHGSDLDDLKAELTAKVTGTVTLPVEGRPGYAVRYRTDFTGKDLDAYRKRARDRKFADGIDGVKFASILLAANAVAIVRKGTDLEVDGQVANFQHRGFMELIEAPGAVETVRRFYGLDGHVDAAARALMVEAGWGDEVAASDPTD